MILYTIRRILLAIPVLFAIVAIVFVMARSIPGDPCKSILGEKATESVCERFIRDHGLDQPISTQFAIYMGKVLRGDLGESIRFSRPVTLIVVERLPLTMELGFTAMLIAVLVGVPAGIISAIKRNSLIDTSIMIGANFGVSIPVFVLGLIFIYIFAVLLRNTPFALPPSGRLSPGVSPTPFYEALGWDLVQNTPRFYLAEFFSNFYLFNSILVGEWDVLWDGIKHLIMPAFALSTIPLAIIARMTRSSMLEVLGNEYIRTARAKGLSEWTVIMRHAFRNALLPVVTITGLQLGGVFSGAVLTETIFSLAGIGLSIFEAITARDFPIIQGLVIVISIIYVLFNLLVDLSYAFLDPRIRLQ
jgi:peptide/nickel transport system permease protein